MEQTYTTIGALEQDAKSEGHLIFSGRYVAIVNKLNQDLAFAIYLRSIVDIYLRGIEEENISWVRMKNNP